MVFLGVFALDAFSEGTGFWAMLGELGLHLVPASIVMLALAIGWRWEWLGGVLFMCLGVFYVATSWGQFPLVTYVVISGPLLVVGALFLLNWTYRGQLRAQ
jgi:hypothetical protein